MGERRDIGLEVTRPRVVIAGSDLTGAKRHSDHPAGGQSHCSDPQRRRAARGDAVFEVVLIG